MTSVRFTKAQATGNDFVMIADPDGIRPLTSEMVAALADRHFGIGADGVIRVVRSVHLPEGRAALSANPQAEWFMDYWNADGSVAEMCGNGVRAFARYLTERGLADLGEGEELAIGTRAGVKTVRRSPDGFSVDIGRWRLSGGEPLVEAAGAGIARPGLGIDVGNPHIVVALPDAQSLEALDLGRAPRLDPDPIDGANVEFVVPIDPLVLEGTGRVRMRVHERGVGETLSCGTGIAATALAVRYWAGQGAPSRWRVAVRGGEVGVEVVPTADGEHVRLSGPAELVFDGEVQSH